MSETYSYDAAGNLTSRTDFNGHVTTYVYDTMNRLLSRTPDPVLGGVPVTFTYTPTGKRASMTDASGTTTYTYDQRDRLLTKSTPQGTLTYTYDASGNVSSVRSSNINGTSTTYSYDALNRLSSVTDAAGNLTPYFYDDAGNLAGYNYANGVQNSFTYDNLNRLINAATQKGTAALASYAYTLGPGGNHLTVAELSGRKTTYGYLPVITAR
jgi:YD repeat-containing protein